MRTALFSSAFLTAAVLFVSACEPEEDMSLGQGPGMTTGQNPAQTGSDASTPGPLSDASVPSADAAVGATGGGTAGATGGTGGTAGGAIDAGVPQGNPTDAGASADATVPSDGAATPADGGANGDAGFDPCPASGECKILPLGDSITDGFGVPGGYRIQLFRLAVMNMKKITYVGSKTNGPQTVDGMPFPRRHEGTSGITIGRLDDRIPTPGLNDVPHIVLLHIGTNDMYMSPSGAPDRLGKLIDGVAMAAPEALIVVSTIIPLSFGGSAVDTYNEAIPAVVQQRIDSGKHVLLIDQFTGFPTSELADGVHPGEAGYSRMAGKWYEAISKYLK